MSLPSDPWSIGIYAGESPLTLAPMPGIENPVISREDIHDAQASFVADPFMLRTAAGWHMIFEVLNGKGEFGLAESRDGRSWEYRGIVLAEEYHLSYPFLFAAGGEIFMVPETLGAGAVRLYRADPFPTGWRLKTALLQGRYADPTLAQIHGLWCLFACPTPDDHDSLALFTAPELTGPWTPHPANPLVSGNPLTARPAGRPIEIGGRWYRFAQECSPIYGRRVRAFEILELTAASYREREMGPVLEPTGSGWNGRGMHHMDAHPDGNGGWIACVDGRPPLPVPPVDEAS